MFYKKNYYDKLNEKIKKLCNNKDYSYDILDYPSIGVAKVKVEDDFGKEFIKYYSLSKKDINFLTILHYENGFKDPMLFYINS